MAKLNLAVHGIDNTGLGLGCGDTFVNDQHAGVQMDYVMANPPFNIKDWARDELDPRWRFGVPPARNANYAWIQHILSKLAPGGDVEWLDVVEFKRREGYSRANRRGRLGVVHGRAARAAVPQHRDSGVRVVLRLDQGRRQARPVGAGPVDRCPGAGVSGGSHRGG